MPKATDTAAVPSVKDTLMSTAASIVVLLTSGLDTAYHAVITTVATWGLAELVKLGAQALSQINTSIHHFVSNLKKGYSWGQAMAGMLTEVWNGVKSDLAMLATDFVEAVGKLLQGAGLIAAT